LEWRRQRSTSPFQPPPITEEDLTNGLPVPTIDANIFNGNSDADSVVASSFENVVKARYIRFLPRTWNESIAMRVEVFGQALGLSMLSSTCSSSSGHIHDMVGLSSASECTPSSLVTQSKIVQGSFGLLKFDPSNTGRLLSQNLSWNTLHNSITDDWFTNGESWCPNVITDNTNNNNAETSVSTTEVNWLAIDFGCVMEIQAIALMGNLNAYPEKAWVTSFALEYLDVNNSIGSNEVWQRYGGNDHVFIGNQDQYSVITHGFNFKTRKLRFVPLTWHHLPFMRPDVFVNHKSILPASDPQVVNLKSILTTSSSTALNSSILLGSLNTLSSRLDNINFSCSGHDALYPPHACRMLKQLKHSSQEPSDFLFENGWCPSVYGDEESIVDYLEIDLSSVCAIQGIAIAGHCGQRSNKQDISFVTKYSVSMSSDRVDWTHEFEMEGNDISNWNQVIIQQLPKNRNDSNSNVWYGRFVRLRPQAWVNKPILRVELYGVPIGPPLGLQNESISNDQLSASSYISGGPPKCARIGCAGSWRPEKSSHRPFLTIKLKGRCLLSGIATSGGCVDGQLPSGFASSYRLEVSTDPSPSNNSGWRSIGSFDGNSDENSIRYHLIQDGEGQPIEARFIRLIVTRWGYNTLGEEEPALRLELFGIGVEEPCGLGSGSLSDSQLLASSEQVLNGSATLGRLNSRGSWCAASCNTNQWLQIDLKQRRTVVALATQGKGYIPEPSRHSLSRDEINRQPMHVSSYLIDYSNNGEDWKTICYSSNIVGGGGGVFIFKGNKDNDSIITHRLLKPILARYIRFKPLTWFNGIAMRAEVYCSSLNATAMEDDAAAFEDSASETRPVLLESSNEEADATTSGNSVASKQEQKRLDDLNGDIEAVLVKVSISSEEMNLGLTNVDTMTVAPRPGMLIVLSDAVGKVNRIQSKMGVLLSVSDNGQECTVAMSLSSAMSHVLTKKGHVGLIETVPLSSVRTIARFFNSRLKTLEDVRKLKLTTNLALGTHYARAALLALLSQWRDHAALSISTKTKEIIKSPNPKKMIAGLPSDDVDGDDDLGISLSSMEMVSESSDTIVETNNELSGSLDLISLRRIYSSGTDEDKDAGIVGNCSRLVDLVKLIAANEGALRMSGNGGPSSSSGSENIPSSNDTTLSTRDGNITLLRSVFQVLLEVEAKENETPSSPCSQNSPKQILNKEMKNKLSQLLVDECCWHFTESTKPTDSRQVLIRESLHPYFPRCNYRGEVKVEGATAIRVHFDPKCSVTDGASYLYIALDKDFTNIIARYTGGPTKFKSLLIHSDRFYFKFESDIQPSSRGHDRGWGYRFRAMPLLGLQWLKEEQVLCDSSLEWACWLLDLLLSHAQKGLLPQGAVHNTKVFSALVRYLRSGGVPYKHRVIALLTRLLQSPHLFTSYDPPSLGLLGGIAALVRDQCDLYARIAPALDALLLSAGRGGMPRSAQVAAVEALTRGMLTGSGGSVGNMLSLRLQALVELVVATQMAERKSMRSDFNKKSTQTPLIEKLSTSSEVLDNEKDGDNLGDDEQVVKSVLNMIVESSLNSIGSSSLSSASTNQHVPVEVLKHIPLAPPPDSLPVLDVVMDTLDCATALLEGSTLSPQFLSEAFVRAVGTQVVIDGEYLLANEMHLNGQIDFKGAKELHIRLLNEDSDDEAETAHVTQPPPGAIPGGPSTSESLGTGGGGGGMPWDQEDFSDDEDEDDEDSYDDDDDMMAMLNRGRRPHDRHAEEDDEEDFDRFVRRMMNRDRRMPTNGPKESTATICKPKSIMKVAIESEAVLELDATMNDYPDHEWDLDEISEEDEDDEDECKEEHGAAEEKDGEEPQPVQQPRNSFLSEMASRSRAAHEIRRPRPSMMPPPRGPPMSTGRGGFLHRRGSMTGGSAPPINPSIRRSSHMDILSYDDSMNDEITQLQTTTPLQSLTPISQEDGHEDGYIAPSAQSIMGLTPTPVMSSTQGNIADGGGGGGQETNNNEIDDNSYIAPSAESVIARDDDNDGLRAEEENEEDEELIRLDIERIATSAIEAENEALAADHEDNLMIMMSMGLERSWCLVALRRVRFDVESAVAFCFENQDSMPRISQTDFNDRVTRYASLHAHELLRDRQLNQSRAAARSRSRSPPQTSTTESTDSILVATEEATTSPTLISESIPTSGSDDGSSSLLSTDVVLPTELETSGIVAAGSIESDSEESTQNDVVISFPPQTAPSEVEDVLQTQTLDEHNGDEDEDDDDEVAALAMSMSLNIDQHQEETGDIFQQVENNEEEEDEENGEEEGSRDEEEEEEEEEEGSGEESIGDDEDGAQEDDEDGHFGETQDMFHLPPNHGAPYQQQPQADSPINAEALEEMIMMGIPPEAAEYGLRTNDNVLEIAMAYIFENGVDTVAAIAASQRNQRTIRAQDSSPETSLQDHSSPQSARHDEIERLFAAAEVVDVGGNDMNEAIPTDNTVSSLEVDAIVDSIVPPIPPVPPVDASQPDVLPPQPEIPILNEGDVNPIQLPPQPIIADTQDNPAVPIIPDSDSPPEDLGVTQPVVSSEDIPPSTTTSLTVPLVAPSNTPSVTSEEILALEEHPSSVPPPEPMVSLPTEPVISTTSSTTTESVIRTGKISKKQSRLQKNFSDVDVMVMVNSGLYFSLLPTSYARADRLKEVVVCERNGSVGLKTNRLSDASDTLQRDTIFKLKRHPVNDRLSSLPKPKKKSSSALSLSNDEMEPHKNESLYLIESAEHEGVYLFAAPDGTLQLTRDANNDSSAFMFNLFNGGRIVSLRTIDGRVMMVDAKTNKLKIDVLGDEYLSELTDTLGIAYNNNELIDNKTIENGPWYHCFFNMMSRTTVESWKTHRFTTSSPGRPLGLSNKTSSENSFELTCSSTLGNSPQQQQLQHSGIWTASAGRVRFPIRRREGQTGDDVFDKTPGSWVAGSTDTAQFLCVDIKRVRDLTGFAVQGPYGENMRVRQFNIQFSLDGKVWASLLNMDNGDSDEKMNLPGNANNTAVVTFKFSRPIRARYVKLIPTKWANAIALRVELFGPQRYRFCSHENHNIDKNNVIVIPGDKMRYKFSNLKIEETNELSEDSKPSTYSSNEDGDEKEEKEVSLTNALKSVLSKSKRKHYRFSITAVGLSFAEKERWLQGFVKQFDQINKSMNTWDAGMDVDVVNWLQIKANDSVGGLRCESINASELTMSNRERMQMQKLNVNNIPCWNAFPYFPQKTASPLELKEQDVASVDSVDTGTIKIASDNGGSGGGGSDELALKNEKSHKDNEVVVMDAISMQPMGAIRINVLHIRIALLQCLNNRLRRILPFIDLGAGVDYFTGYKLRKLGYLIFYDLKMDLLDSALRSSGTDRAGAISMNLDHQKKTLSEDCGNVDPATSQCVFAQAFHQCTRASAAQFRSNENAGRVFSVNFVGEAGIDAGGVYRDAITEIVGDLHSPEQLSLFSLCPNGIHKINSNMDKYIPNSSATSPLAIQMFEFVGKLMGVSLRTKATLPFNFPSFVWKGCVGGTIEVSDIEAIDQVLTQTLRILIDPQLSESEFASSLPDDICFTTTPCNGGDEIELIPGGASKRVTYHNRSEYSSLVIQFRIHEFDRQLAAIRRGLATVVPLHTLQLFTWQQVEELVAGKPEIDLEYLKKHTEYRGYSPTSPVVTYFWKTMEALTQVERSQFIRFVWGRSRLPLKGRSWPQSFKIQRCSGGDDLLPVTHTCFFSIELPEYSSEEMCRKRLITAINYGAAGVLNS